MRRLALLLLAACSTPATSDPSPPTRVFPRTAVRQPLAAGTVVRLLPSTSTPGGGGPDLFVDGLWREAMRIGTHLDVAAGTEDTAAPYAIELHWDRAAGALSTTLRRADAAPFPLATASGELGAALDRLALATREALGDPAPVDPPGCAAIYSGNRQCVEATERALVAASDGRWTEAVRLLRKARTHDPGCTVTLAALAKTLLALGSAPGAQAMIAEADKVAIEGLSLGTRLAPTTKHRLAHVAVVTRGRESGRVTAADHELLALGEVAARERPHDPHVLLTRAVALGFLVRHAESAPLLRQLARRWPQSAEVAYHLTFAELALGNAEAARAQIQRAAARLPRQVVVVPTALALFHCGAHDELHGFLASLAEDPSYRRGAELHELREMQAAHALLTDRAEEAVQLMLEDLDWIRQRPSMLEHYALDVAETGEVLVRIGHAADLTEPLRAFEEIRELPPIFAQVMVLLGGLVQVAAEGRHASAAEAHLDTGGQAVWASVVRAAAFHRRGELMDELRERVFQYQATDSPLARAALAAALEAAGSTDQATRVLRELRARLLAFDLRHQNDHPLMRPTVALAYLATEKLDRLDAGK
jgi:tetratricopeptide (TPR) repeat protein